MMGLSLLPLTELLFQVAWGRCEAWALGSDERAIAFPCGLQEPPDRAQPSVGAAQEALVFGMLLGWEEGAWTTP